MTIKEALRKAQEPREREKLIRSRISGAITYWASYKTKVDKLTRLVLGDHSMFKDGVISEKKASGVYVRKAFEPAGLSADFELSSFDEGVTNAIQEQIFTLVVGTAYQLPEFGFESIKPEEATINAEYLKNVFRPEGKIWTAGTAMVDALFQRVIGGLGWVAVLFKDGTPYLKSLDVVSEIVWDPTAKHPEEARWAAQCLTEPLAVWLDLFEDTPGMEAHFEDLLKGFFVDPTLKLDQPVEMIEYWSLEGEHCWFRADKLISNEPFLLLEDSPWYVQVGNKRQAFLATVPHRHIQVPRSKAPSALVEAMAPHQAAMRSQELSINHIARKFRPFWDMEEGAYEEEEEEKLGKQAAIVKRRNGTAPAKLVEGAQVPSSLLDAYTMARASLTAAGAGNGYAQGRTTPVRFSKEVQALMEKGDMQGAAIAQGYADHWTNVGYNALALGKVYDQREIELRLDDVVLQFGPGDPIGQYLRLTPDVVVSGDSSRFKDPNEAVNEGWNLVNMASAMADVAPNSRRIFWEKVLKASGEKNLARHFEQPLSMVQSQAAEAEASLQ